MPYDIVPQATLPDGLRLIDIPRYADKRGWFMELHREQPDHRNPDHRNPDHRNPGQTDEPLPTFCQDNVSLTTVSAAIRGLHFQRPPFAQAKLVTVLAGAILDVVVDLRPHSPRFGQATMVHLSASSDRQLFVPLGFAHGFCSLQPETLVHYKVSTPYAPGAEGGIIWNDPDLAIEWPFTPAEVLVSDKDAAWPRLRDITPVEWAA